ncbi:CHASE2 domain-containing protein [Phormidesmis priestleyi]|uniref:CHASE2 domain-containing protein n=1 Tax=Phormidesmis priestleyi TaxID=268141 RepID=UPI0015E6B156|nr:CHASE2 domain-containing protein [Phormidesmis priestleyi]
MSENLLKSIVLIESNKPKDSNFGTGFVIDRDDQYTYVLTCAHVVNAVGGKAALKVGELSVELVVLGKERSTDLAVLAVQGLFDKPLLKLRMTTSVGEIFITAGFHSSAGTHQLLQNRVKLKQRDVDRVLLADGTELLSAWNLEVTQGERLEPGCSGSPVVQEKTGEVTGVVIHRKDDKGQEGLAISITALEKVWAARSSDLLQPPPEEIAPPSPNPFKFHPFRFWRDHNLHTALRIGGLVTVAICGIRFLGGMQSVELAMFDQLMRSRLSSDEADDRLLIIEVDQAAINDQDPNERRGSASLSDRTLNDLLQKLDAYQPKTIGLDIYRNFEVTKPFKRTLGERLRRDDRVITVCKVPDSGSGSSGIKPPPEVPSNRTPGRVGFSDFVADEGTIVRRQLLEMSLEQREPPCFAQFAFSLQLAAHYLHAKPEPTPEGYSLKGTVFKPLQGYTGGYQGIDAGGHQILLNYRSPKGSPRNIAERITLKNFLAGDPLTVDRLQNRIVLIGVTDPDKGDSWNTPYQEQIPGVTVQAQMVSQILSVIKRERPLIWTLPQWAELLWIWAWATVGGLLAWRIRSFLTLLVFVGGAIVGLCFICVILLMRGGWLPLVPSGFALAFATTGVRVVIYSTNPGKPS